jgi:protein SCO1/2
MGPRNLFVAIVLAIALSAGIFVALRTQAPSKTGPLPAAESSAFVLPAPMPLPEFSLVDQRGESVDETVFEGQWDLVFFGFTHCPDICPATLQILSTAKDQLAAAGQAPLPRIVLVSVDPERDTPELLAEYLAYFGDDNLGITGSLEEIRKLTSALGIYFDKRPTDDDNYSVDHSAAVLIIDPDGNFYGLVSGPHQVASYVNDLPPILGSR